MLHSFGDLQAGLSPWDNLTWPSACTKSSICKARWGRWGPGRRNAGSLKCQQSSQRQTRENIRAPNPSSTGMVLSQAKSLHGLGPRNNILGLGKLGWTTGEEDSYPLRINASSQQIFLNTGCYWSYQKPFLLVIRNATPKHERKLSFQIKLKCEWGRLSSLTTQQLRNVICM